MSATVTRMPSAPDLLDRVDPVLSASMIVKDYLNRTPAPPEKLESVSVTKLLNPGQAYYDVVSPVSEELEAFQKRMAGTGAHDMIEDLLGLPAEQSLDGKDVPGEPSLDGIRGKLDAYVQVPDGSYVPVEIKNVARTAKRPSSSHVEQLAMYCAMLSSEKGLLVRVQRNDADGSSSMLTPIQMEFPDIQAVKNEMARRRDLIIEAVANRDPSILPACAYSRYNCKYKTAGICNCVERKPFKSTLEEGVKFSEVPDFLAIITAHMDKLKASMKKEGDRPERYSTWQLLIPRKLYFDAIESVSKEESPPEAEAAPSEGVGKAVGAVNKKGLEMQLQLAIKKANKGRISMAQALPMHLSKATITSVDGKPFSVKVRMVRNPIGSSVRDIAGDWGAPEDIQRLAVQAYLVGSAMARLYVWNWKVEGEKLQVFDLKFRPEALAEVGDYARSMPVALSKAISAHDHTSLPVCPKWLCKGCEFHDECRPEETTPAR